MFDNLIQLDHVNIVKFHAYWIDDKQPDNKKVSHFTHRLIPLAIYAIFNGHVTFFTGDFYHGVHVFWFFETIPEENETKQ